jgi:hypothetical protein
MIYVVKAWRAEPGTGTFEAEAIKFANYNFARLYLGTGAT